jgi:hypothetical protein
MVLSGPLLVIADFATDHEYFPIPARYGLSIVPVLIVLLASCLRKTSIRAGGSAIAAIGVGLTVFRMVMA